MKKIDASKLTQVALALEGNAKFNKRNMRLMYIFKRAPDKSDGSEGD